MRSLIAIAVLSLSLSIPAIVRAEESAKPLLPTQTFSFGNKQLKRVEGQGLFARGHWEETDKYYTNGYIYEYTPQGNPNYICIVTVVLGSDGNGTGPSCIPKSDAVKK